MVKAKRSVERSRGAPAGPLRAAMVAACLLAAGAAFAVNPFLGSWSVESFGQSERLVFEFTSDTVMLILIGDERTTPQSYAVNESERRLTPGSSIVLRYDWIGPDLFSLYMTDESLEQMVAAFTASMPQAANPLTDGIIAELRDAVRGVFIRNPFMRGTRVE